MKLRMKLKMKKGQSALPVTLQIGKSGVTPELIAELVRQLKQRKTVKIRLLAGAFSGGGCRNGHPAKKERRALAQQLAEKAGAQILHQVGFTVVLHKK